MSLRKPGGPVPEGVQDHENKEALLSKLLKALEVDDKMIQEYTVPTRTYTDKARAGIITEFDVYKAAHDLRKKFLELAKEAGDLPDELMEKTAQTARDYVAAGGVKYYENNLVAEKLYVQLFAIINVPEFIKHPKAREVLEAFISDTSYEERATFPMRFEAYLNFKDGEGYSLKEQIDGSYVENLEKIIDDPRLWIGRQQRDSQNSEVRRILFANVADVLNHLAKRDGALDLATVSGRIRLLENNIGGAAEVGIPLVNSLMRTEVGKKALEKIVQEGPGSMAAAEARKVLSGYYSNTAY